MAVDGRAIERGGRDPHAVCVYCGSSDGVPRRYLDLAAETGSAIAARGWTLVSGGGRRSMMGAVALAAREGGARTVGVIPRSMVEREWADHDSDELLVTETMRERKALMDSSADGFVALAGGLGTLEELLEIWVARSLGMHTKPVVVLDPDGLFAPLRRQLADLAALGFVRPEALRACAWAAAVPEALDAVERLWAAGPGVEPSREEAVEEMLEAEL
jgi:uncharacterized protein (TIGR00730 family)